MRIVSLLATVITVCILSSGCSTIIHGTTQDVPIDSTPDGANVRVDGFKATTPTKVERSRKATYIIQVTKESYKSEIIELEPVLSGAVTGNIIAGGLIGWGVDAASEAQYRLVPESIHVVLHAIRETEPRKSKHRV